MQLSHCFGIRSWGSFLLPVVPSPQVVSPTTGRPSTLLVLFQGWAGHRVKHLAAATSVVRREEKCNSESLKGGVRHSGGKETARRRKLPTGAKGSLPSTDRHSSLRAPSPSRCTLSPLESPLYPFLDQYPPQRIVKR